MWPFSRARRTEGAGDKKSLGALGEKLAAKALKKSGLKVLARNFSSKSGEIDIIALDSSTKKLPGGETVVFVEVKTRTSDDFATPESAVNAEKQKRIRKAASTYLSERFSTEVNYRFDIVSVVIRPDSEPEIKHIPEAF